MCPLTPRAAPVAVNKTMASRRSWMLAVNAAFSSSLSVGFLGSSDSLRSIVNVAHGDEDDILLFELGKVDWELALCARHDGGTKKRRKTTLAPIYQTMISLFFARFKSARRNVLGLSMSLFIVRTDTW